MERTVYIKTMTNYFPLIYQRLVVGSLCLIFIVKAEDKGCVRRVAGSEKREWQKVRGGEWGGGRPTTTQFTLQH